MLSSTKHFDTILVGGGLQSGLIVAALRNADPSHSIFLIEREQQLAGNHTWSFHLSDIDPSFLSVIEPLIETRWPSYCVSVGRTRRELSLPYASISSSHFAKVVERLVMANDDSRILLGSKATDVDASAVRLANGDLFTADVVIDSRGPDAQSCESFQGGFQKFWGFEFELESDWPDANPIVMDDSVDQSDGFRFFYVLPFDRRRVMIEDTRFSNTPTLDRSECLNRVESYLHRRGIPLGRIVREEHGVLPMPIDHLHRPSVRSDLRQAVRGGYAGGWFHAATGYSFPMAATFAHAVAAMPRSADRNGALRHSLQQLTEKHSFQASFGRFLNRLLFELVKPESRYQIFQRFYHVLSEERIARFYRHRFRRSDAARIIIGMPPTGLRPFQFVKSFFTAKSSKNCTTSIHPTTALREVAP